MRALLAALALLVLPAIARAAPVEIALTFDDLPAHSTLPPGVTRVEVGRQILEALHAADVPPVYGFVNAGLMEHEPASAPVLTLWRAAGNLLGNHTFSHLSLSQVGVAAFEADLMRGEPAVADRMAGGDWRWLRFPYLDEGATPEVRDGIRRFLGQRGYRIASVTMSFDDYAWNEPYARCMAAGDTAEVAVLESRYLQAAEASFAYSRALSQAAFGRDIPYVLLMHEGAFDARMLPRLLALYQRLGVRFVTLEAAERDPAYSTDYTPRPTPTPNLESVVGAKGLPIPKKGWSFADLDSVCRPRP